jgi:catechol 2,3-dioxygenase-like lactoylglutathione lyase family enzyme
MSVSFYRDGLGLEVQSRIEGPKEYHAEVLGYPGCYLRVAFFKIPDSPSLELIQYVHPEGTSGCMETYNTGNGHLSFVVDDLHGMVEKLKKLGGTPRSEAPVKITSGPNLGLEVVFIRDPDGISIELFQPPAGSS